MAMDSVKMCESDKFLLIVADDEKKSLKEPKLMNDTNMSTPMTHTHTIHTPTQVPHGFALCFWRKCVNSGHIVQYKPV